MIEDIERVLLSEEQIHEIVSRLGRQISEDYKGKKLLMVSVLKGSVVFMADLMRAITIPCEIDFMAVSSYGSGTESSGEVKIIKDLDRPIEGYDLLLVEDILDSGKTLHYISEMLRARRPASIKICTHDKGSQGGLCGNGSARRVRCRLRSRLCREVPQRAFPRRAQPFGL